MCSKINEQSGNTIFDTQVASTAQVATRAPVEGRAIRDPKATKPGTKRTSQAQKYPNRLVIYNTLYNTINQSNVWVKLFLLDL